MWSIDLEFAEFRLSALLETVFPAFLFGGGGGVSDVGMQAGHCAWLSFAVLVKYRTYCLLHVTLPNKKIQLNLILAVKLP